MGSLTHAESGSLAGILPRDHLHFNRPWISPPFTGCIVSQDPVHARCRPSRALSFYCWPWLVKVTSPVGGRHVMCRATSNRDYRSTPSRLCGTGPCNSEYSANSRVTANKDVAISHCVRFLACEESALTPMQLVRCLPSGRGQHRQACPVCRRRRHDDQQGLVLRRQVRADPRMRRRHARFCLPARRA